MQQHVARAEDLALLTNIGAGLEAGSVDQYAVFLLTNHFYGDNGIESGGDGCSRHDAKRFAVGNVSLKGMASRGDAADGKALRAVRRKVGRAKCKAVHGRVVEKREVELSVYAFGKNAAFGLEQRHGHIVALNGGDEIPERAGDFIKICTNGFRHVKILC